MTLIVNFSCQYEGILGQDFWKEHRTTIKYCDRTITMNEVIMSFDNDTNRANNETHKLTLKPRMRVLYEYPLNLNTRIIVSQPALGCLKSVAMRKLLEHSNTFNRLPYMATVLAIGRMAP
jgi:hypothetical protein